MLHINKLFIDAKWSQLKDDLTFQNYLRVKASSKASERFEIRDQQTSELNRTAQKQLVAIKKRLRISEQLRSQALNIAHTSTISVSIALDIRKNNLL